MEDDANNDLLKNFSKDLLENWMSIPTVESRGIVKIKLKSGEYITKEHGGRSNAWQSFSMVTNREGDYLNYVCCKDCWEIFSYKGHTSGTSTLKKHTVRCKKKLATLQEAPCASSSFVDFIALNRKVDAKPTCIEDSKLKMSDHTGASSNASINDSFLFTLDNNDTDEDHPLPPSPEQFLTEADDCGNHSSSMPSQRPESYKLRHNNHLTLVLESLADDDSFMDVTLTAQGRPVKAHKSVLSAVSPYFKMVLKQNPCQHPIIIMPRDIKFQELNCIIDYVYRGEITIAADDLSSLLKTAELLQVSGLSTSESSAVGGLAAGLLGRVQAAELGNISYSSNKNKTTRKSKTSLKTKKESSTPTLERVNPADFLSQDMAFVKEELETENEEVVDNESQDETDNVEPKLKLEEQKPQLQENFHTTTDMDVTCSVENGSCSSYKCPYCAEVKRPLEALETHMSVKHPSKPSFICKNCSKVFIKQLYYQTHFKLCTKLI